MTNLLKIKGLFTNIELKKIMTKILTCLNKRYLDSIPQHSMVELSTQGLWAIFYWLEYWDTDSQLKSLIFLQEKNFLDYLDFFMDQVYPEFSLPLLRILGILSSGLNQMIRKMNVAKTNSFLMCRLDYKFENVNALALLVISNLIINSDNFFFLFFKPGFVIQLNDLAFETSNNKVLYEIGQIFKSFLPKLVLSQLKTLVFDYNLFAVLLKIIETDVEQSFNEGMNMLMEVFDRVQNEDL